MPEELFQDYTFDLDEMAREVKRAKAARVGLQLPEGLKRRAASLARALREATGTEVLVLGGECFGACDVAVQDDLDLVFNIGHSDIPNMTADRDRVRFVELPYDTDYAALCENLPLGELAGTVGLTATVQHVHGLEHVKRFLEGRDIKAVIGRGGERLARPGQVLGCNFSAARACGDVDSFLFLGSGRFHALGIFLALGRPVFILDPYSGLVAVLEEEARDQYLKKRWGAVSSGKPAQRFGIVVSTKPGQYRMGNAEKCREMLEDGGKEAFIIVLDLVTPQRLDALGLDAYVITACPRIAVDDSGSYKKPLLTPVELEALLGERTDLVFDEME